MDAGAAQGGRSRGGGAVQGAQAVLLIDAGTGTGNQTHEHHPFLQRDLHLAWPETAVFIRQALRPVMAAPRDDKDKQSGICRDLSVRLPADGIQKRGRRILRDTQN